MSTESNGNLHCCLSLSSMNTSTQFDTTPLLSVSVSVSGIVNRPSQRFFLKILQLFWFPLQDVPALHIQYDGGWQEQWGVSETSLTDGASRATSGRKTGVAARTATGGNCRTRRTTVYGDDRGLRIRYYKRGGWTRTNPVSLHSWHVHKVFFCRNLCRKSR